MTELELKGSGSELTKKQELNNHVVLMRKIIRQARVHVICKLTRELRLLQKRKGPEKILNKAKRKADRLIKEISAVKKLHKDAVSIFALQNKKPLLDILRNEKSTIENRGIARLAHFSGVQTEVNAYRERNPHWELQIPVLLEKSKEKLRKIKKRQESKTSQEVAISHDDVKTDKVKNKASGKSITETKEVDDKPEKKQTLKKSGKGKQRLLVESSKPPIKLDKSEGTLRVQILTDLKELENDALVVNENPEVTSGIVPKKRPKSAFFVGGEEEIRPEKELKSSFERKGHSQGDFVPQSSFSRRDNFSARKQDRFKKQDQEPKKFRNRYFEENPRSTFRSDSTRIDKFDNSRNAKTSKSHTEDTKSESGHLHPSWEAKKRQAAGITSFKGKKITFGDD